MKYLALVAVFTALALVSNSYATDLNTGLAAHWSFDDGNPSIAYDYSGNGNHGDIYGASVLPVGKSGRALSFDGINDYIDTNYQVGALSSKRTINFWINTTTSQTSHIFSSYDGNDYLHVFLNRSSNTISYGLYDGANEIELIATNAIYRNGSWHMITITQNGPSNSDINIYIDGISQSLINYETGRVNSDPVNQDMFIGAWNNNGTLSNYHLANVELDEFRVYNRVLSNSEIQLLYNSPNGESGPVAYWSFDDGSASIAHDYSGNGNNGNIYGALPTTGLSGKALSFDGNVDYLDYGSIKFPSSFWNTDFSISLWIYPTNISNTQYIIWFGTSDGMIYIKNAKIIFVFWDGTAHLVETQPISNNAWYHVVATRNKIDGMKIYIDKSMHSSNTFTGNGNIINNQNTRIGDRDGQTQHDFYGRIDEVRIYNRTLSTSEITDLHVDNRNTISLNAINNWDGTVTVSTDSCGNYELFRLDVASGTEESLGSYLGGNEFKDKLSLAQLKKTYKYMLKDANNGSTLGESNEVRPDIVIVLVRGYDMALWSGGYDPDYWNTDKQSLLDRGLVSSVKNWFEGNGITCWDASVDLDGTESVIDSAEHLSSFINLKRTGVYAEAKVFLFGHSLGGIISRMYASYNPNKVINIFCAQTPHTGSPLSLVRGVLPNNAATAWLMPHNMESFNNTYILEEKTKIYSTYSSNAYDVNHSVSLAIGSGFIGGTLWGLSDGAVPVRSAKGLDFFYLRDVEIEGYYESNLDHFSCHKHPNILNKIMEWLGYPQSSPAMLIKMQDFMESESETVPLYYIDGFTGQLDSSHPFSTTVNIGTSQKAYFRVITSDANSIFTLTNPNAVVVDPTDPIIIYNNEDGIQSYEISSPLTGSWTINLTTLLSEPDSVQYGITAFEDQYITLSVSSEKDWTNTGQSMPIMAELHDNSGSITGATVTADITLPDNSIQSTTLFDNGSNGDLSANDGIYSYSLTSTSLVGIYNVSVNATGLTSTASSFERTAVASFTVTSADIDVSGSIIEEQIDTNSNGHIDFLRYTVSVNVAVEKNYRLTASFLDPNSETITLVNTGSLPLTTDSNSISIEIDAKDIVMHNVSGPYTLSNIEILDGDTSLAITDAPDYVTAPYHMSDFEPLDSDGDGLSDAFEQSIGTDINKIDTDADGATDYQEVTLDGDSHSYNPEQDSNPQDINSDCDIMTDGYEISYGLNPLIDDSLDDLDNDGLTNQQEYELHTRPDKFDTDGDGRNDKWEVDNSTNPIVFENYILITGDINLDAATDIYDLSLMASQWLSNPGNPSADIAPQPDGDGEVNVLDFVLLAKHWLE